MRGNIVKRGFNVVSNKTPCKANGKRKQTTKYKKRKTGTFGMHMSNKLKHVVYQASPEFKLI